MSNSLEIVCPRCGAVNRVPATRLAEGGRCGQCKEALFTAHPVELDGAAFRRHVSRNAIPLVVDFWAPWCAPCRSMAPAYEQAAARLEPRARLAKVNTENEPELAGRLGIRSIPTLAVFKGGREVDRRAGAMDLAGIMRWVEGHL